MVSAITFARTLEINGASNCGSRNPRWPERGEEAMTTMTRAEVISAIQVCAAQIVILQRKVAQYRILELSLRPICPKCRCREGMGTIEALGCGGDYETMPCPVCCPEEFRRYYD